MSQETRQDTQESLRAPLTPLSSAASLHDGKVLELSWEDGAVSRFHALWLRDNAMDETTRSPVNHQRLIKLGDIPHDIHIGSIDAHGDRLDLKFLPNGPLVSFSSDWLRTHRYDRQDLAASTRQSKLELFDATLDIQSVSARHADMLAERDTRRDWLGHVRRFGFARLTDGPTSSEALLDVVAAFGYVRETHYGRYFEVRTEVNPSNLAYTSEGLQPHTDNPYRDPVPTLQVLYCLQNSAEGGTSLVVDGFHAAERLRQEDPEGFALLAGYPARFEYRGAEGVHLQARRPLLELGADGALICIRFNNRSAAPIVDVPFDLVPDYYAAYRRFGELIDEPGMNLSFHMQPGESFIVDNTRVLHGRTGFAAAAGCRWLQGCYADIDGLLSTLAILESPDTSQAA